MSRARHGFTLIELLVVIGIIAILIAISVVVGAKVASSGKGMASAETIRVLDATLGDFINRVGKNPDPVTRVTLVSGSNVNVFPLIDGTHQVNSVDRVINSVGLFIQQAEGTGGVGTAIAQINDKYVRRYDPDGNGPQPELTTVFDAFDRPIRMVHPSFDGTWTSGTRPLGAVGTAIDLSNPAASPIKDQTLRNDLAITEVRRNFLTDEDRAANAALVGDSDGGVCPSPKPYFYSAGDDGDPSTLTDNIYTTKPRTTAE